MGEIDTRAVTSPPRRLAVAAIGGAFILAGLLGVLAVLERIGLPAGLMAPLMVGLALAAFAAAGLVSRTMLLADYDLAGRAMPVTANALATAAMLIGLVLIARDPVATGLGAAVGTLLAGLVVGPAVNASGAATLPAYLGRRYGGLARMLAALIVVASCFPALIAFVAMAMTALARTFSLTPEAAAATIAAVLVLASAFGGLRGIGMAQLAAGLALAAACVAVALSVMAGTSGNALAVPSFDDDRLLTALTAFVGTAALPPLALRLATGASPAEARQACLRAALMVAVPIFIAASAGGDAIAWRGSAVVASLVEAALLLALLAAAAAFAFAIGNTIAHDVHHALLSPRAAVSRRLIVARLLLIAVIAGGAAAATIVTWSPAGLALWALSIAGAGLLPLLVFGATKLRITVLPAAAGMAVGVAAALIELTSVRYDLIGGASDVGAGFWGAVAGSLAIVTVALCVSIDGIFRRGLPAPPAPAATPAQPAMPSAKQPSRRRARTDT